MTNNQFTPTPLPLPRTLILKTRPSEVSSLVHATLFSRQSSLLSLSSPPLTSSNYNVNGSSDGSGGGDDSLTSHGIYPLTPTHVRYSAENYGVNTPASPSDPPSRIERVLTPLVKHLYLPNSTIKLTETLKDQLSEPLILMLLASASLSLGLGQTENACSILGALTIVATVATIQEHKSDLALEALNSILPPTCTVLRTNGPNGTTATGSGAGGVAYIKISAKELVLGDVISLNPGDRVPCDCRVLRCAGLSVDESSLTGEGLAVYKSGKEVINFEGDGSSGIVSKVYEHSNNNNSEENAHKLSNELLNDTTSPPLTSQSSICFNGTLITSGHSLALCIAISEHTELGKISKSLSSITRTKSPLQKNMDVLGQQLAFYSTLFICCVLILGVMRGQSFLVMLDISISLAVAAIPEGLPICVTITLALGVLRMSKRNAVVKKMSAVESLGCTNVTCTDKTGTLTENVMELRETLIMTTLGDRDGDGGRVECRVVNVSGCGNNSEEGKIDDNNVNEGVKASFVNLLRASAICTNAQVSTLPLNERSSASAKVYRSTGQPTEIAIIEANLAFGMSDERGCNASDPLSVPTSGGASGGGWERVSEEPFSSDLKMMSVSCAYKQLKSPSFSSLSSSTSNPMSIDNEFFTSLASADSNTNNNSTVTFLKGMPEAILSLCTTTSTYNTSTSKFELTQLLDSRKLEILAKNETMGSKGLRVLAVAIGSKANTSSNASSGSLTFLGLIAMHDPPRKGCREAIRKLRIGGVRVVMITGDSRVTACAVAGVVGILGPILKSKLDDDDEDDDFDIENGASTTSSSSQLILSGQDLDLMSPVQLSTSLPQASVFYRTAPRHKLLIVQTLQSSGLIVAMTGDGVNDAPALKVSDIGISMGLSGTDVAKEASDVVLMDDDFSTIVEAIREGKGIFYNIRNFLSFQLSTSIAALTIESVATFLGLPSPLNAMQILWINIIMDGPPAQSLGVEPVSESVLNEKPRDTSESILTLALVKRAIVSGMTIVVGTLFVFYYEMSGDMIVTKRDTTMTFMTFVNFDLFNAYCCRSSTLPFYKLDPFSNTAFLYAIGGSFVGQMAVIFFVPLQRIFQTEALGGWDLLLIVLISSSVLWTDTMRKLYLAKKVDENGNSGDVGDSGSMSSRIILQLKGLHFFKRGTEAGEREEGFSPFVGGKEESDELLNGNRKPFSLDNNNSGKEVRSRIGAIKSVWGGDKRIAAEARFIKDADAKELLEEHEAKKKAEEWKAAEARFIKDADANKLQEEREAKMEADDKIAAEMNVVEDAAANKLQEEHEAEKEANDKIATEARFIKDATATLGIILEGVNGVSIYFLNTIVKNVIIFLVESSKITMLFMLGLMRKSFKALFEEALMSIFSGLFNLEVALLGLTLACLFILYLFRGMRQRRAARVEADRMRWLPGATDYEILGVPDGTDNSAIRRAYHLASLKYLPDLNQDPTAHDKMQRINAANNSLNERSGSRKVEKCCVVDDY